MIIDRIEIDNFGKFKDFSMDFSEDVNVIFGENEAGKSTICAFIYAMFYDLPSSKQKYTLREDLRKRYMPLSGGDMSGAVYFTHENKKYVLKRKMGKTPRSTKVTLADSETWEEINDERKEKPGEYFFGVGEDAFLKTLYIGQLCAKISRDKNDEIIEKLSNLRQSGDEDVSYQKTLERLTKQKHSLISVGGGAGKIVKLKEETEKLKIDLTEVLKKEALFRDALKKRNDAEVDKGKLKNKIKELEKAKSFAKKYENYKSMKAAEEKLLKMTKELSEIEENLSESNDKLEEIKKRKQELSYLDGIDEKTSEEISHLEMQIALLEQKLVEFKKAKEKADETQKEMEEIKNERSGSKKPLVIASAVVILVISVLCGILVTPLSYLGLIIALALFAVSFMPSAKEKEKAEKIKELTMKIAAFTPDLKEENEVLTKQKEYKTRVDEILHKTHTTDSGDLLRKLSERRNIDAVLESGIKENTLLLENHKRVSTEIEILKPLCEKSFYPEGVMNIPGTEISDVEKGLNLFSNELISCEKKIAEAQATISSLAKDEKNSVEIKNQIEENEEKIKELTKVYEATNKAISWIEQSYEILRSDFAPVLSGKVKDAITFLTDSKYTDVRVMDDYSLKVQAGNEIIDADFLSGGTYDLLYLSLRIGISKVISKGEIPLLILDDTFLQFDENRTKRAAEYVKGNTSKQILYFTCHKSQCDVFGENVNLITF